MKIVKVEFEMQIPVEATSEQIQEWVEYNLSARANILLANPLHRYEFELHEYGWDSVCITTG